MEFLVGRNAAYPAGRLHWSRGPGGAGAAAYSAYDGIPRPGGKAFGLIVPFSRIIIDTWAPSNTGLAIGAATPHISARSVCTSIGNVS